MFFGSDEAPLRIDGRTWASVTLSKATFGEHQQTTLPLQDVQIKPGNLFLESDDNLCYYHQLVVPGKFVDQMLVQSLSGLTETRIAIQLLDGEIDRRKGGGTKGTWEDQTRFLQNLSAPGNDPPGNAASNPNPLAALESDSLLGLRGALAKGSLPLGRRGQKFFVRLPLTPSDAVAGKAYLDAVLPALTESVDAEIQKAVREGKLPEPDGAKLRGLLRPALGTVEVVRLPSEELEICVDGVRLLNLVWQALAVLQLWPKGDPHTEEMATTATDHLPVDTDIQIRTVVEDFKAGRLRSHPSRKPAVPGTQLTPKPK